MDEKGNNNHASQVVYELVILARNAQTLSDPPLLLILPRGLGHTRVESRPGFCLPFPLCPYEDSCSLNLETLLYLLIYFRYCFALRKWNYFNSGHGGGLLVWPFLVIQSWELGRTTPS